MLCFTLWLRASGYREPVDLIVRNYHCNGGYWLGSNLGPLVFQTEHSVHWVTAWNFSRVIRVSKSSVSDGVIDYRVWFIICAQTYSMFVTQGILNNIVECNPSWNIVWCFLHFHKQDLHRKTRGILNKLTPQNFDHLLGKMKELHFNTAEELKGVIDVIFEKVTQSCLVLCTCMHNALYSLDH